MTVSKKPPHEGLRGSQLRAARLALMKPQGDGSKSPEPAMTKTIKFPISSDETDLDTQLVDNVEILP